MPENENLRGGVHPHADADFDDIIHFIARDNPLRAVAFVDGLQQRAVEILSVAPHAGRRVGANRYIAIGRYVVVYAVEDEVARVRVLMITEGHRDRRAALEERR